MANQSILPPGIQGVMFFTGGRGLGKSFLAAQVDLPDRIAFFDFESKGEGIHQQMPFGLYLPINQIAAEQGALGLYDTMMAAFRELPQGQFTVAVLDNIAPFEQALTAEAIRNASKYAREYGLDASKIKRNAWGHTHACVNFLIGEVCALLHSKGIRVIVATAHIKARWEGGQQVPNKYRIKGHDRWQELSILTLVLIPGHHPPIPAAIVQKEQLGAIGLPAELTPEQIEAMMRGETGHIVSRRLPRRIPDCTFQRIRWYLYNPTNWEEPNEDEVPTEEELDPYLERLTREQLAFVTLALQHEQMVEDEMNGFSRSSAEPSDEPSLAESIAAQQQRAKEVQGAADEAVEMAAQFANENRTVEELKVELRKAGYPMPIILKAVKAYKGTAPS